MRHRKIGRILGRNPNHQRALLRNLAIALILTEREVEAFDTKEQAPKVPGRIITTLTKAKEMRPFVEKCVTLAIKAQEYIRAAKSLECKSEKNSADWKEWRNGEGWKEWQKVACKSLAYRRRALQLIGSKEAVQLLFDKIGPRFEDRNGGYTRILKLANPRLGDAGKRAIIEFVGVRDRETQTSFIPNVEE
ncbi:MAG: L17 family ribosomal protein [Planctomycetia bacterium]|nr:L17 family ribosomal protein [Planctomycetia bacterium]